MIAIVAGNGKSLLEMPKELLDKYASYGMNYCPFQPTYFICVDKTVLIKHPLFVYALASEAKRAYFSPVFQAEPEAKMLYALPNAEIVYPDTGPFKDEVYWSGFTSTYVALKLAYYAGFDEVHLWGVDHDREWKHYRDDYPSDGDRMNDKRLDVQLFHLALANDVYRAHGRRIVNHSYPSDLDKVLERG